MNAIKFLAFLVLMLLLGASGASFHAAFHSSHAPDSGAVGFAILLHCAGACLLTAAFWDSLEKEK